MYSKIFKRCKKEDNLNQYFFVFVDIIVLITKPKKERRKSMKTRCTKYGCTTEWCKRKRSKRAMRTIKEVQQKRQEREAGIYTRWQNDSLSFFFVCFFFLEFKKQ